MYLRICEEITCVSVRLRGLGDCLPRFSAVEDGTVGKDGAQLLALEELQQTLLGPVGILDALAAGVYFSPGAKGGGYIGPRTWGTASYY